MFHIRGLFILLLVLSLGLLDAYVLNNTTTVEPSPVSNTTTVEPSPVSNATSTSTVIPDPNNDNICTKVGLIYGLAIIGGGAVAGGIIALIVVRITICAMGFRSGGIGYDTIGSAMMSHEGNVRSGGCVANLQSCGASGFGCCSGCVIWILGVVLGGGVTYWIAGCSETNTL